MNLTLPTAALAAALGFGFALPFQAAPQQQRRTPDEQAVHAAIENYVLGFYRAEPARLERALSPDLKKMGYRMGDEGYRDALHMTLEQAVELATGWNDEGQQGDDLTYEITLHEVCDQTATAKLTAYWGQDYFHLAKGPDGWRIHHVMWQSAPPAGDD